MSADTSISVGTRRSRLPAVAVPALGAAGAWLLAFAAITYLALEGGGYATVVRGQVGIALWWMVLVGAAIGVLPVTVSRRGWAAVGLLAALLVWTLLSLSWTESSERTFVEVARVAALLGAMILATAAVGRARARQVLNGIACAVGLISVLAVLSRLHPAWFPALDEFTSNRRLSYPVNYWNALAGFVAMGLPAVLAVATRGRTLAGRSLAAGVLPVMALCVFLTVSRGGLIAAVGAVALFLVLVPNRLPKFATVGVAAIGGAILVAAASQRSAVQDGLGTALAHKQGDELLLVAILVAVGVAALQLAVSLIDRHATPRPWMEVSRARATRVSIVAAVLAVVIAVVAGAPGALDRAWTQFKEPRAPVTLKQDTTFDRLASTTGNGRYQYWQSAAKAEQSKPLQGRGAGTFTYWWARNRGKDGGYVRDAHSLYMQTFGELGIVGLLLIAGFLALLLGSAILRSVREIDEDRRVPIAAAGAGILAFAITASVEWVWQIAVLPVTLVLFGAIALAGPARKSRVEKPSARGRLVAGVLALVCLPLLAISVAGATSVADSQAAANRGDLAGALQQARTAARVQPYAATPRLQEALVLEQRGDLKSAAVAIAAATSREPTNYIPWLIRSRIAAELGHGSAAVTYFTKARSLNPYAAVFQILGKP